MDTYHEHHADIPRHHRRRTRCQDEGGNGNHERQYDVEISFTSAVGMPRVEARHDEAKDVRWAGQEESRHITVAQSLDDRREEVGDGSTCNDAKYKEELQTSRMCEQHRPIESNATAFERDWQPNLPAPTS